MNNRFNIAKEFANRINSDDINQIILFGSVARGDDTIDSDIDILIISSHGKKIEPKIADEVFKIIMENEELISAHVMSEKHFEKTKNYSFLTNVLKEGVIIGWNIWLYSKS